MIPILAFLEACPGIGLFVSGVILLTVSTILYTEQVMTLSQIIPLAFTGACLADHFGFYIGYWFGPKLGKTAFAQKRANEISKSEKFILKYGTLSILGGRLIPAVRSLVPLMIGVSGTKPLKFSMVDLAACAIWSSGLGALTVGLETLLN